MEEGLFWRRIGILKSGRRRHHNMLLNFTEYVSFIERAAANAVSVQFSCMQHSRKINTQVQT